MANVGVIYTARTLTGTVALKIYALILSVWAIGRLVWVSRVFDNFFAVEQHGFGALSNYFLSSLTHAHLAVQAVLVVAAVAFISLIVDAVRSATTPQRLSF